MNSKNDMITCIVGCVCVAAIVISIVAAFYFGVMNSGIRYHATMNECIQARGTWVPTGTTGACVINKQ